VEGVVVEARAEMSWRILVFRKLGRSRFYSKSGPNDSPNGKWRQGLIGDEQSFRRHHYAAVVLHAMSMLIWGSNDMSRR
jgi:hypothetical protein